MLLLPINIDNALTVFALEFGLRALLFDVELHITFKDAEPTALLTDLHSSFTFFEVVYCLRIFIYSLTPTVLAFEIKGLHVRLHDSVHFTPVYRKVISAFLWAAFVYVLPGIDAALTEN